MGDSERFEWRCGVFSIDFRARHCPSRYIGNHSNCLQGGSIKSVVDSITLRFPIFPSTVLSVLSLLVKMKLSMRSLYTAGCLLALTLATVVIASPTGHSKSLFGRKPSDYIIQRDDNNLQTMVGVDQCFEIDRIVC